MQNYQAAMCAWISMRYQQIWTSQIKSFIMIIYITFMDKSKTHQKDKIIQEKSN